MSNSPTEVLDLSPAKCLWLIDWHDIIDPSSYEAIVPKNERFEIGAIVVFEKYASQNREIVDFLATIGDPISRPAFIHEYAIHSQSVFAAMNVGLDADKIIAKLQQHCHTPLSHHLTSFIRRNASRYGRASLVLRGAHRWILTAESAVAERLSDLLSAFIVSGGFKPVQEVDAWRGVRTRAAGATGGGSDDADVEYVQEGAQVAEIAEKIDIVNLRRACASEYPLTEEYAYRLDVDMPILDVASLDNHTPIPMRPSPTTAVRPYQDRALYRMFGNGRAQSGIIVLPCGAGKTLVGIMATVTLGRPTVVICPNSTSVLQWQREYIRFTNATKEDVFAFVRVNKAPWAEMNLRQGEVRNGQRAPVIVISTYGMLGYKDSPDKELTVNGKIRQWIRNQSWGMLLVDEVHTGAARTYRETITNIRAHCRLGLTATLVREDEGIKDLYEIIGPRLYEADWLELREAGYLSNVQVIEVRCPMDPEYYRNYLKYATDAFVDAPVSGTGNRVTKSRQLQILNPGKVEIARFLINYHAERKDRILVFCDDIGVLTRLSQEFAFKKLSASDSEKDKEAAFDSFRAGNLSILGLSRIGDVALDLPEANVLIQMAGQGSSRRQEAQRLGRILRPKENAAVSNRDLADIRSKPGCEDVDKAVRGILEKRRSNARFLGGLGAGGAAIGAYFYNLVSTGTREEYFSLQRRQFLINQGYAITVCTDIYDMAIQDAGNQRVSYNKKEVLEKIERGEFRSENNRRNEENEFE